MEPKKNPKYDVHRYRSVILNFSLLVSLCIVISAFEWTVAEDQIKITLTKTPLLDDFPIIPITRIESKPETQEPVKVKDKVRTPSPTEFVTVSTPQPESSEPLMIDQNEPVEAIPIGSIEIPKDSSEITFDWVEKMPQPVGGYDPFYNLLRTKLKYPARAIRNETKGKVYVAFTVDEKGNLSNFAVQKGIGDGCDEEAIRVIKLSKWEPGKQRGRPVKVRMVQPINFCIP